MVSWTKFGIGKGASEHPQVMRRKMEEDDIGHWALNQLVSGSVPSWNRQLFEYPMSMSMWFLMWWSSWGVDTHQPAEFNASKVPCPDQGEPGVVGKPCRFSKPHRGGGFAWGLWEKGEPSSVDHDVWWYQVGIRTACLRVYSNIAWKIWTSLSHVFTRFRWIFNPIWFHRRFGALSARTQNLSPSQCYWHGFELRFVNSWGRLPGHFRHPGRPPA